MRSKIVAIFSIFLGIAIILMWIMILSNEQIEEGKTEMSFHLASEFIMALCCLASGIGILRKISIARSLNIAGLGMVFYSVLNAAGYYSERSQTEMIVLFLVLIILTSAALLLQIIPQQEN